MTFTANEIIDRAYSLANVKDTKFISRTELKQYLNEAWKNVYNKCITSGSQYWLKEIGVPNGGVFILPDDFYQLDCIRDPYTGFVLPRKSDSESDDTTSYEMIGETIRIMGRGHSSLVMRYWPKPKELTFKSPEVPVNSNIVDFFYPYVIDSSGTIDNLETGTTISTVELPENSRVWIGRHFVVIKQGTDVAMAPLNLSTSVSFTDVQQVLRDSLGDFYFIVNNELIRENGTKLCDIQTIEATDSLGAVADGEVIVNGALSDEITLEGDVFAVPRINDRTVVINNGVAYIKESDWMQMPLDYAYSVHGYSGDHRIINNGLEWRMQCWVPDTHLDFPNSLLFEVLSWTLAHQFLLKLEAPTDSVLQGLGQASEQFFSSLSNDGSYYRIRNVY